MGNIQTLRAVRAGTGVLATGNQIGAASRIQRKGSITPPKGTVVKKAPVLTALLGLTLAFSSVGSGMAQTPLPRRVASLSGDHPAAMNPDRNGSARVVLRLDRPSAKVCYRVAFENMVVRGVYVYRNGADVNDPFVKLYDEAPTADSPLKGCVTETGGQVDRLKIRRLKRHPARFFVKAFEYDGSDITGTLGRP